MSKKYTVITTAVGAFLILLGLRQTVFTVSLLLNFGNSGLRGQFVTMIATGAVFALQSLTCGVMLAARRSLKSVCTAAAVYFLLYAAYNITAAILSVPQLTFLRKTPDSQLPGLNTLWATLGLVSVGLMFAEAVLYIGSAAFGLAWVRKGKCFIPAVVFPAILMIFLFWAAAGSGTLPWLLFTAAIIYTKITAFSSGNKIDTNAAGPTNSAETLN